MGYLDDYLGAGVIRVPTPSGPGAGPTGVLGQVVSSAEGVPEIGPFVAAGAAVAYGAELVWNHYHASTNPNPPAQQPIAISAADANGEVRKYQNGNLQPAPADGGGDPNAGSWTKNVPWVRIGGGAGLVGGGLLLGSGGKQALEQLTQPVVGPDGKPLPNPNLQPTLIALAVMVLGVAAIHAKEKRSA